MNKGRKAIAASVLEGIASGEPCSLPKTSRKVPVNVIWQPKYIGAKREAWLLENKMRKYAKTPGNQTVYITFEKDERYGMSGKVFRVRGGSYHVEMRCELFYHEGTGCHYYRIPLEDLVEVHGVKLPDNFLQRVESYRSLHSKEEPAAGKDNDEDGEPGENEACELT